MEYEIFKKDYIRLNFLDKVINTKSVAFDLFLESDGKEKNFLEVRDSDKNVYRFNNFNVTEDVADNCITFRPTVIGCYVYFKLDSNDDLKMDIVQNGTNLVAQSFDLPAGVTKIIFDPQGSKNYIMKIDHIEDRPGKQTAPNDTHEIIHDEEPEDRREQLLQSNQRMEADIAKLNSEIADLENRNQQLADQKKSRIQQLEKIKAEYDKNCSDYAREIEEIKARYGIDKEILELYENKNTAPAEDLFRQAEAVIQQIEERIRIFVGSQARKTAEIEGELKIGRKE